MNELGDVSQHVPKQYAIFLVVWWSLKRLHVRYREDESKLIKHELKIEGMWSSLFKACKERFILKVLTQTNAETSQGLRQHGVFYSEWAGPLATVLFGYHKRLTHLWKSVTHWPEHCS